MNLHKHKIILASKSPRRKELLEKAGFNVEIFLKEVEENYPDEMDTDKVAVFLAIKKANECSEAIKGDEILLTADSVVILDRIIYGKPKDKNEALSILKNLSGRSHKVITGVCLKSSNKTISFSSTSIVTMDALTEEEINYYIEKYQPYDKAGAYGVQEWIGLCKISKIEGSYANIMGLPVDLVYKHLKEFN
jgi:septum formation protein